MKYIDLVTQFFIDFRSGILGGMLYGLYSYFYQKRSIMKSIVAFLIGAISGSYLAHPIHQCLPLFSVEVAAFGSGLFSMKFFEALVMIDYTEIIISALDRFIKFKK